MRLLITFARAYPTDTLIMLLALLLAGLAEGVSLTALLPFLSTAINSQAGTVSQTLQETENPVTTVLLQLGVDPTLGVLLTVIVIGIVLKSILVLFANKRVGYTVAQVTTNLRLDLLKALLQTRWPYFLNRPIGGLANAMATEALRASQAYINGTMVITLLIQCCVYTAVALLVSWQATVAALLVGLLILTVSHGLIRMARQAGKRQTKLLKSLLARLTDTLQSVKPLKAMARENLADAVLRAETSQLNLALQREVFSNEALKAAQEPMFAVVIATGIFLALTYWGLPFATVMTLAVILGRVIAYMGKVQRQYQKVTVCESAFWSLQATIHEAEQQRELTPGHLAPTLEMGIRLENICLAYGEHTVFHNLAVTIPVGSLTTLIGPSGVGKTTIIDLITGLLRPQQGEVFIDGLPLAEIDLRAWRRMVGYVPQENLLLHDTVLNNITLGDLELTENDAEYALRAAGAWEFVASMADGLKSNVGERGTKLSGGQRQRIMIARALVHRPRFLILDEATSALDPDSTLAICATLRALRGQLTILAVSHQPFLMEAADRVYRLQEGAAVLLAQQLDTNTSVVS
jgi:ATP-binding cassette subfamily C protein